MAITNSLFKLSLGTAIALATLTLGAANANATNLVNYSFSNWTGKDTDLGSFGAGYGADFTVDIENSALVGEASGNASIELFDETISIIDLSATAKKPKVGELVRILPNHACPVSNLFDKVVFVEGEKVLGAVKVDARGMVQ